VATSSMKGTMVSSRIQLRQHPGGGRSRLVGRLLRAVARISPLVIALLLSSAAAQAAGQRIGVPKFKGQHEALVRKEVMHLIKSHGYELVGPRAMEYGMSTTSAGLDSSDGRKTLAKELSLSAIVTAEVGPKRAKIVVYDGEGGAGLGDASFSGANPRKLAHEVKLTFWKKLGSDVTRGKVPTGAKKPSKSSVAEEPEEPENAEGGEAEPPVAKGASAAGGQASGETAPLAKKTNEPPAKETSAPSVPSGRPWVHVELGAGGLNRNLTFSQSVTPGLLSFKLGVGPIAVANVVIYPFDPLVGGPLGNIGLEAEIQQGFATSSTLTANGMSTTYPSVVHDYAGGVRYRIPFSAADDVYLSATAGEDAFTFTGRSPTNILDTPDTIYHYVRPGVGLHLAIASGFSVAVGGGYRVVLNHAGTQFHSSQFFPRSSVAGADAELEVRYALSHRVQVRAGLEWRRYWFALNTQPGDTFVAGSAVDQSFAFTGRVAFLLGGSSVPKAEAGGGAGDEEAPPPPPPNPNGRGHKPSDEESGGDSDSDRKTPSSDE
jgi:hypothetical protein